MFRQITMAEILSDALKENQCKVLLRLIAGLTDGAGRPKSARKLEERRTNAEARLDLIPELIDRWLRVVTPSG
jgi:hypothetical protein